MSNSRGARRINIADVNGLGGAYADWGGLGNEWTKDRGWYSRDGWSLGSGPGGKRFAVSLGFAGEVGSRDRGDARGRVEAIEIQ